MSNFQKLNLNPKIISTLEKKGYSNPTPIQEKAIPHLLAKKDLLGIAQTGTGKTAAFSLPILDLLSQDNNKVKHNKIRALILTPTRELAVQIGENIYAYGKGLKLKHSVIFGGVNEFHQIKALKSGVDILVATPGRLLDLANRGYVDFSEIEIFVLDEADRMLDMGFINDVRKIITKLPQERQNLLFSATMPGTISNLANSILRNPVKVEITPQSTTVERINQKVYLVAKSNKPALLLDVLTRSDVKVALVFSRTKHGADKIVSYLEKYAVQVSAIHGNKSQVAREKALSSLRTGKIKVLVATDIAARGIDIPNITHVINYDIPLDPESYVHRIGRTARAGREGVAISFCDFSENLQLRAVEQSIRMKIEVDKSHPFHGKAPIHDASEGRLLSRKSSGNSVGRKTTNNNDADKRKYRGESSNRSRSSTTQKSDSYNSRKRSFSKSKRSSGSSLVEESKSITKKILGKFGFKKFRKKIDSNEDSRGSYNAPKSRRGEGRRFSENSGSSSKSSRPRSSFSSYKKPFNKNRRSS